MSSFPKVSYKHHVFIIAGRKKEAMTQFRSVKKMAIGIKMNKKTAERD